MKLPLPIALAVLALGSCVRFGFDASGDGGLDGPAVVVDLDQREGILDRSAVVTDLDRRDGILDRTPVVSDLDQRDGILDGPVAPDSEPVDTIFEGPTDAVPDLCIPNCANKRCGEDDGCGNACVVACPPHLSSRRQGGPTADDCRGVAVDGSGNITITGYFTGTTDLGGGPLVSAGDEDIFMASYNATGAHRWSKRVGGTAGDFGEAVAVGAGGDLFFTGSFDDAADFGGGSLSVTGNSDIYLAAYDTNGVYDWAKQFGSSPIEWGSAAVVDGSGNVTITGRMQRNVDFGGGTLSSGGLSDVFVASYDATGAYRWARVFGLLSYDNGSGVAVDGSGNVYVTGDVSSDVDFGGGSVPSFGAQDIFLVSYDSNGGYRWAKRIGSGSDDKGRAVAVDGSGNVTITGYYQGAPDFGDGPVTGSTAEDIFIASYDTNGALRWWKGTGGGYLDTGEAVAVDGSGNVIVTGFFQSSGNLGGLQLSTAGGTDAFVVSFSSAGAYRWGMTFGGTGSDSGQDVVVDSGGVVTLVGEFSDSVDFGGGTLISAGSTDIFILQLAPFGGGG